MKFILIFLSFAISAFSDQQLIEMKKLADESPTWQYPYHELIDSLKNEGKTSLLIFSYGSLMDPGSASRTLSPKSLSTSKPAIGYGVARIFDRDIKVTPDSRWCTPKNPQARGMLNVIPTESLDSFINGLSFDVEVEDLPNVLSREVGYDLIPIVIADWDSTTHPGPQHYKIAYTFHAPQNSEYTDSTIMPRPGYYELTRDAASQFGPLFSLVWYKTTFLSDGKTPIIDWEQEVLNENPETQSNCPQN